MSSLAVTLAFIIGPVFGVFAEAALVTRALVCIGLLAPLGLLLGFGFPTALGAKVDDAAAKPGAGPSSRSPASAMDSEYRGRVVPPIATRDGRQSAWAPSQWPCARSASATSFGM